MVDRYRKGPGRTDLLTQLAGGATPAQWAAARRRFREAREAVLERVAALEQVAAGLEVVDQLDAAAQAARWVTEDAQRTSALCRTATERAHRGVEDAEGLAAVAAQALEDASGRRPAVLSRLLQTRAAVSWAEREAQAREAAATAAQELSAQRDALTRRLDAEQAAQDAVRAAADAEHRAQVQLDRLRTAIDACPQRLDAGWWAQTRAAREKAPVWIDAELHRRRAELFAASMHVHEVFARSAGKQMAANLRTWMALQTNEVERTAATRVTLAAWQAFFLLVPLASTTFASMARLLQHVPTGSLGWLIVDEAGQAVPAAAVGGLARFRRAVVVGDPQQLEPVVTLPAALVAELVRHHGAPAELAPDRASVQTLADAVSRSGTERLGQWIGLPLVVHNRCLDPMFTVANDIAYGGEMIYGRPETGVAHPLGASRWIDVPRPDGAHFREEDAEQVLALLRQLDWSTPQPEVQAIAVVSPFKEVVRELDRRVRREILELLAPERRQDEDERQKALESVPVGTVHTFQGREKVAVVLVLGGGSAGARQWAAGTPHLLNVAVTRAKDRLFVIGDRSEWKKVGHTRTLDAELPA